MKVEGEYIFKGPREVVYEVFNDPNALAAAVPGMDKLEKTDETHYAGTINIRIGPLTASFDGLLSMEDIVPPESCTLVVEGKGKAGFVKGVGYVKFFDLGEGNTKLTYVGEANIGGTLASVGQRMIDSVMKSMFKSIFDKLQKSVEERCQQK